MLDKIIRLLNFEKSSHLEKIAQLLETSDFNNFNQISKEEDSLENDLYFVNINNDKFGIKIKSEIYNFSKEGNLSKTASLKNVISFIPPYPEIIFEYLNDKYKIVKLPLTLSKFKETKSFMDMNDLGNYNSSSIRGFCALKKLDTKTNKYNLLNYIIIYVLGKNIYYIVNHKKDFLNPENKFFLINENKESILYILDYYFSKNSMLFFNPGFEVSSLPEFILLKSANRFPAFIWTGTFSKDNINLKEVYPNLNKKDGIEYRYILNRRRNQIAEYTINNTDYDKIVKKSNTNIFEIIENETERIKIITSISKKYSENKTISDIFEVMQNEDVLTANLLVDKEVLRGINEITIKVPFYKAFGQKYKSKKVTSATTINYYTGVIIKRPFLLLPKYKSGKKFYKLSKDHLEGEFELIKILEQIQLLVLYLKFHQDVNVELVGHTDSDGEAGDSEFSENQVDKNKTDACSNNYELSIYRSWYVKQKILEFDKFLSTRITIKGKGQEECFNAHGDGKNKPEFRKVEINYSK